MRKKRYIKLLVISFCILMTLFIQNMLNNEFNNIKNVLKESFSDINNQTSFKLNSTLNINAANGKGGVDLDWSEYNGEDKIFKVYQKKENSSSWQSISSFDFSEESEPVKVLNVYPNAGGVQYPDYGPKFVNFTYRDGTTAYLPKSAALKVWMEGGSMQDTDGTIYTFDNYGRNPETGKQLIYVTEVNTTEFNNNPQMIWNYDVLMQGSWDANNVMDFTEGNILSDEATNIIEQYINSGYGVCAGHDTIGYYLGTTKGLSRLRDKFNIKVGSWTPDYPSDTGFNYSWSYGSSNVIIQEEGLITNFPWQIGKIGDTLTIPYAHTTAQSAFGNVWLQFDDNRIDVDEVKGNMKYYLTTWNNTAMIQIGQGKSTSTEDERKIMANVLFYLKQRTNATSFTDNSSQDKKAPDAPTIKIKGLTNNKINLEYVAKDNGSIYSFYVESYDKSNISKVDAISNEVTQNVTTGTKGYYYVIDDKSDNNFNIENSQYMTENILSIDKSNVGKYIHMKAIDEAGNIGDVSTIQIQVPLSVNVKYVDKQGKEISDPIKINGYLGESYNTNAKEIENYELVSIPDNANGIMEDKDIEVTYIYDLIKGKVTVTKVDKNDNTKLLSGAVFKIEKMTEDNTIDDAFTPLEKTTDNNGKVEFTELIVGKYRVTEIKAPTGYELKSESIDIEITKEAREQNILATDRMKLNLPETGAINYSLLISILGLFIVSSVCIYKYKSKNEIN